MASIDSLKASDGSGNASAATVQATRSPGATTIQVDTVQGINDNFFGSMGTPHTFTDPVTSETITVISEATAVDFKGHVDGTDLEIDAIAPGYVDGGSEVGDIVIIKPTTQWGDEVAEILEVSHNDDGTFKDDSISDSDMFTDALNPVTRLSELYGDFVASGGVLTGTGYGSTLAWSMTAGVVYINGKRLTVAAATGVVVASKDTYFDLLDAGNGTATLVYTGGNSVANGAAAPALAANSVRLGKIVSAASIAAATSIMQYGADSLGNRIYPRKVNAPRNYVNNQEVLTGEYWVDGRPIYRKVLRGSINIAAAINNLAHGIALTTNWELINITTMIKLSNGGASNAGSQGALMSYRESGGNWQNATSVDLTNISITSIYPWGNSWYTITLEYVK